MHNYVMHNNMIAQYTLWPGICSAARPSRRLNRYSCFLAQRLPSTYYVTS